MALKTAFNIEIIISFKNKSISTSITALSKSMVNPEVSTSDTKPV